MTKTSCIALLLLLLSATVAAPTLTAHARPPEAAAILQQCDVCGGLVVHLGCGDGKLTAALRDSHGYIVQGLDADVARA